MSILFELERMERLAEDLDRLRRPVTVSYTPLKLPTFFAGLVSTSDDSFK